MRRPLFRALVVLVAALPVTAAEDTPRLLTLDQRIQAQEAIQRTYYSYQVGATRPFEEAVPRDVLEAKVRRYLKKSAALEVYWKEPVGAAALSRELRRIARETRFPERLEQVFDALNHDPLLILECLARPSLVERLTYQRHVQRPLADGDDWGTWWASVAPSLDEHSVRVPADLNLELPSIEGGAPLEASRLRADCDAWDNGILDDVPQDARGHTFVWTGSLALAYGGSLSYAGWAYDPLIDDWTPMARPSFQHYTEHDYFSGNVPEHTAVWTGSEMIVWGNTNTPIGARYDPLNDSWTETSTLDAPEAREYHTAVWTGDSMIVWGGRGISDNLPLGTGGIYDPDTDTWGPVGLEGAPPTVSYQHVAVWTGTQMIVWNGPDTQYSGRYDPLWDAWFVISTVDAPSANQNPTAVWTGTAMIVWGGSVNTIPTDQGGRYDPSTDSWTLLPSLGAPSARSEHSAVWTGDEMIVWGGTTGAEKLGDGALYSPSADAWMPLPADDTILARKNHGAVWTGDEMIVWGGNRDDAGPGGRYDPETGTWMSIASGPPAPLARARHGSVWTGTEMIVWGGWPSSPPVPEASGRYDPLLDAWLPLSAEGMPEPATWLRTVWSGTEMLVPAYGRGAARYDPVRDLWSPMASSVGIVSGSTALWAGENLLIWGGDADSCDSIGSGKKYDPVTDEWSEMSEVGRPTERAYHSAVWTGSEMIVWGGIRYYWEDVGGELWCVGELFSDGARYDPGSDEWNPISEIGAPSARLYHTAVWTGSEMIVWGGNGSSPTQVEGGIYDPATDTWRPTSTVGAPSGRTQHTAVWTGSEMVVWGGQPETEEGGIYDPATDSWTTMTLEGAPLTRNEHSAHWTGNEMIVWGGVFLEPTYGGYGLPLNNGGMYDPHGLAPEVVVGLLVGQDSPGAASLSWPAAERADSYTVIRGTTSTLAYGSYGDCFTQGLLVPEYTDTEPVAPGESYTYLVRGVNTCGPGRLGADSSHWPRVPAQDPCP